jgi:hypothetical protein
MAYDYTAIMQSQFEMLQAEGAAQAAELEAGQLAEDPHRVHLAAANILEIDARMAALTLRANQFVANQQAAPRQNPGNLSDEELAVAKASYSAGTEAERVQSYIQNKAKYQRMIASANTQIIRAR